MGSLKNQGPLFYDNCMMNANVVEASRRAVHDQMRKKIDRIPYFNA